MWNCTGPKLTANSTHRYNNRLQVRCYVYKQQERITYNTGSTYKRMLYEVNDDNEDNNNNNNNLIVSLSFSTYGLQCHDWFTLSSPSLFLSLSLSLTHTLSHAHTRTHMYIYIYIYIYICIYIFHLSRKTNKIVIIHRVNPIREIFQVYLLY